MSITKCIYVSNCAFTAFYSIIRYCAQHQTCYQIGQYYWSIAATHIGGIQAPECLVAQQRELQEGSLRTALVLLMHMADSALQKLWALPVPRCHDAGSRAHV